MRKLIALAILFALAFSLTLKIDPSFARVPLNSSISFSVVFSEGEGKVYKVEAFGPYLSWNEKEVWIGPSGKEISLVFTPKTAGEYTVTVKAGNSSASAKVVVYKVSSDKELLEEINYMKKKVKTKEEKEKLEEIEELYNSSKYEIAKIKLKELEEMIAKQESKQSGVLFHVLILFSLFLISIAIIRLLPL